jgi:pimeloyl-ACP methyl ester carboxylesterase
MLDNVKRRFTMTGAPAFPLAHLMTFWGGALNGFSAFKHNPEDYARAVALPTLVLGNEGDRTAPPEDARRLFASLPGPADLHLFPGGDHPSIAFTDPGAWIAVVAPFLEEAVGSEGE